MADERTDRAIEIGSRIADEVLRLRQEALRERASRSEARGRGVLVEAEAAEEFEIPEESRALLAAARPSAGVLIAEGDSWFDYPFHDVLELLERRHAFEVESVAHYGDRIEDMAYSGGQLAKLSRAIERSLSRRKIPRAILLSGGGNDIAGDEFALLLNHARSPIEGVNESVARGIIDERVRDAYVTIIKAVNDIALRWTGQRIPILLHGYGFPVPDGRGFAGGFWILPGPWLEPGFRQKGYVDDENNLELQRCTNLMRTLIERFNAMLQSLEALPELGGIVRYVDLRALLSNDLGDYRRSWANELHPTREGFIDVTDAIAAAIP